jgi:hypothetical protein
MAAARRKKAEEARRITLAHGCGGLGTAAFESTSHRGAGRGRRCPAAAVTGLEACATSRTRIRDNIYVWPCLVHPKIKKVASNLTTHT